MEKKKAKTLCKKSISLLLALLLVLTAIPLGGLTAFAAVWEQSGDWRYSIISNSNKTAQIYGYIGTETEITVPSELDGYSITEIREFAFQNNNTIKTVIIPDSVCTIGKYAFSYCAELENIVLPVGLTEISESLFMRCYNLKSVELPETINSICGYAFQYSGLERIILPQNLEKIGNCAFEGTKLTEVDIPKKVSFIADDAFLAARALTHFYVELGNEAYTSHDGVLFNKNMSTLIIYPDGREDVRYQIPETVNRLANFAFYCNQNITYMSVSDNVTELGSHSFYLCGKLQGVTLPSRLSSVPEYAFGKELKSITFTGTQKMWTELMRNCKCEAVKSATVTYMPSLELQFPHTIENNCAIITGYEGTDDSVCIPETLSGFPVTQIRNSAFSGCAFLTNVTIPDSVTNIGSSAFNGCTYLKNIQVLPNNTVYSSVDGFLLNKSQTELICCPAGKTNAVMLPGSVMSIGNKAFYNCSSLTSITIPNSVTSIGDSAFNGCTALASVMIPDSVTSIGSNAFYNCTSLTSVTLPDSVTSIGKYALGFAPSAASGIEALIPKPIEGFTIICVPGSAAENYAIQNSLFYDYDIMHSFLYREYGESGYEIYGYIGKNAEVTVPDYIEGKPVTRIGENAFYDCHEIVSVFIPDSVADIGQSAFMGCTALTSIVIPNGMTHIASYAFQDCTALKSVTFPGSLIGIGIQAFSGCTALTSIALPSGVTHISDNAFRSCAALASIALPDSITKIGEGAFTDTAYFDNPANWENNVLYINQYLIQAKFNIKDTCAVKQGTKVIADSAFSCCSTLPSVSLPNSLTHIGDSAFFNCDALTSITLPEGLTHIGDEAFERCFALTNVIIPESVRYIGVYAFEQTAITQLDIPADAFFDDLYHSDQSVNVRVPFGSLAWFCAISDGIEPICTTPVGHTVSVTSGLHATEIALEAYTLPSEVSAEEFLYQTAVLQFTADKSYLLYDWFSSECGAAGSLFDPSNGVVREVNGELTDLVVGNTYYLVFLGEAAEPITGQFILYSLLDALDIHETIEMEEYLPLVIDVTEADLTYALAFTPSESDTYYLDFYTAYSVLDSDGRPIAAQGFGYALTAGKTYYFIVSVYDGQTVECTLRRLQTENGFTYVIRNRQAVIVSYEGTAQTVVVPEQLGGYPAVWLYPDSFLHNPYMQSIVIPKSICAIGGSIDADENIFADCPNLETIYGYSASVAEAFANQCGYTFIPLAVAEPENGITVEFSPENPPAVPTALQVTEIDTTDVQKTYDITLTANGNPVQPAAPVTVKIPVPATMDGINCKVYRQEADGTYTDMNAIYQDGYMVFTTDHFSIYVLTTKDPNAPAIAIGDVNSDGEINAVDARWILQSVSGARTLSEEQRAAADVNGDGEINAVDARWVLQVVSGARVL